MPPRGRPIRILIVDRQTLVRAALRTLIETWDQMKVVGEAADGAEALALTKKEKFEIILLELDFKTGGSGVELLTQLLSTSEAHIIILTDVKDVDLHCLAILSGARGLVSKEHSPEQLRSAILTTINGEVWLDSKLTTSIVKRLTPSNRFTPNEKQPASFSLLSPREQELAWLAADGLSNKDIAARLFISETTVRHHMTSVFSKLGLANRLELIISLLRPTSRKPPAPSLTRNVPDRAGSGAMDSNQSSELPEDASRHAHETKRKSVV